MLHRSLNLKRNNKRGGREKGRLIVIRKVGFFSKFKLIERERKRDRSEDGANDRRKRSVIAKV